MDQDQMKEQIRNAVRSEIKKQVNGEQEDEGESAGSLNESVASEFAKIAGITGSLTGGGAVSIAGALVGGSIGAGIAGILAGVGVAAFGLYATTRIMRKINESKLQQLFTKMERAIQHRDNIIKAAAKERDKQGASDFLKENKREIKKATEAQRKAAKEMQAFLNSKSNQDAVSNLTQSELKQLEETIDAASRGLVSELK